MKLSVLKNYLQAATAFFPIMGFMSLGFFIAAQVCTNIWLSIWTEQPIVNGTADRAQTDMYLGVYGALGTVQSMNWTQLAVVLLLFNWNGGWLSSLSNSNQLVLFMSWQQTSWKPYDHNESYLAELFRYYPAALMVFAELIKHWSLLYHLFLGFTFFCVWLRSSLFSAK